MFLIDVSSRDTCIVLFIIFSGICNSNVIGQCADVLSHTSTIEPVHDPIVAAKVMEAIDAMNNTECADAMRVITCYLGNPKCQSGRLQPLCNETLTSEDSICT